MDPDEGARLRPIRFGILGPGTAFRAWQVRSIEALLAQPGVQLGLLMLPGAGRRSPRPIRPGPRDRFLFRTYGELVRPRAFWTVDMAHRLRDIDVLRLHGSTADQSAPPLDESELRRIQDHDLDFILRFDATNARGILRAARYGVWSFRHDEGFREGGGPPGFWEIYNGESVVETRLLRLTDRHGEDIVLRRGFFKTALHSWTRTIDEVCFGSARWPTLVCRDIQSGRADHLEGVPPAIDSAVPRRPTDTETLRFLARQTRNAIRRADKGLRHHEEWSIGIVEAPIAAFLEPTDRLEVRWLRPPGDGRFVADPFGVEFDGAVHVLYEDFDYRSSKGTIATMPATAEQAPSPPVQAIELPVHASYPYLLVDHGEIYCIPETHEAREVSLYRAIEFPVRWEKAATLLKGVAALDSTVFLHEGRWWLACTDQDAGKDLHLFLWHAPALRGPWEPHALNPVKTDVRSSRPAGTPFVHRGVLYRPAQDCSTSYGGGIVVNRVVRLTITDFQEEFAVRIAPFVGGPFPDGIHTLSSVGEITLIDSKRYRFIPSAIPFVLRGE